MNQFAIKNEPLKCLFFTNFSSI